jgi:hypothetical protein
MIIKLESLPGKRYTQKLTNLTKACYKVTMQINDYYTFRSMAQAKGTKKDLGMLVLDFNYDPTQYASGHYANLGSMKIFIDVQNIANPQHTYYKLKQGEIVIGG